MILLPARVRGGELPRKHEAGTASGAVLSLRQRRLDTHATVPCRRHDDPSMFPVGLSGLRAPSRRARDACPGGSPGANLCVPLLNSPMDSHHETGTTALSGVRGVLPSTWPAGAHAWASAKVHASSESRMSQGVGRCHVEVPPRKNQEIADHRPCRTLPYPTSPAAKVVQKQGQCRCTITWRVRSRRQL